jgi:hypothetical protein
MSFTKSSLSNVSWRLSVKADGLLLSDYGIAIKFVRLFPL